MTSFLLVVTAGFLGSFHCTVMCGPFVGYYSMGARKPLANHAAYQAGRLSSYLALGSLAGLLGKGMFFLGSVVHAQRGLIIFMGLLMIGSGLYYFLPNRAQPVSSGLRQKIGNLIRSMTGERNAPATAGLIGMFSTLLPCGFLYAFALTAGASGHPLEAVKLMFGFWLGTLPALVSMGFITRYCSRRFLSGLQKLVPVFLILFGVLAIFGKWGSFPSPTGEDTHCLTPTVQVLDGK